MILLIFISFLLFLLYNELHIESFQNKEPSILSSIMNTSPSTIVEGLQKTVHPYIPYKQQFYKLKRYLRHK